MDNINNTTKVPFKVSARTAKLIGLENFSNEEGAIIELVKNTYDADSQNCILIFDLKYKAIFNDQREKVQVVDRQNSKIYIIDNGVGMTDEIISNQWMTIGTDDKLYEHTSEGGRIKTGAKGIGRFALNRLGLLTNLHTVSKKTKEGFEWIVDWRDFDKQGTTVSEVNALLRKIERLSLKEMLLNKFHDTDRLVRLISNISFESGTVIEITDLNDDWEEDQLQKLFGNLEMLLPPKGQPDFRIDLISTHNIEDFGTVKTVYYDDFDYRIEASYDKNNDGNIIVKITRNELDIDALENRYNEVFEYEAMKR